MLYSDYELHMFPFPSVLLTRLPGGDHSPAPRSWPLDGLRVELVARATVCGRRESPRDGVLLGPALRDVLQHGERQQQQGGDHWEGVEIYRSVLSGKS